MLRIAKREGSPFYQYSFSVDGQRFRGSCETEDADLAAVIANRKHREVLEGKYLGKRPAISMDDLAALYYSEVIAEKSSAQSQESRIRFIINFLGLQRPIHEVNDQLTGAMVSKLKRTKTYRKTINSNGTVNRYISVLRAMNNFARKKGYEYADMDFGKHMMDDKVVIDYHANPEQAAMLIECAPSYLRLPIEFDLLTGLRKNNLVSLRWPQVDLKQRTITLTVKGKKLHTVPLVDRAVEILQSIPGERKGVVFKRMAKGGAVHGLGDFKKAWRTLVNKANAAGADLASNFRFHDLRHTCFSWLVQNSTPIELVKEIAGHSDIATTMRYAHHKKDILRSVMNSALAQNGHSMLKGKGDKGGENAA